MGLICLFRQNDTNDDSEKRYTQLGGCTIGGIGKELALGEWHLHRWWWHEGTNITGMVPGIATSQVLVVVSLLVAV